MIVDVGVGEAGLVVEVGVNFGVGLLTAAVGDGWFVHAEANKRQVITNSRNLKRVKSTGSVFPSAV